MYAAQLCSRLFVSLAILSSFACTSPVDSSSPRPVKDAGVPPDGGETGGDSTPLMDGPPLSGDTGGEAVDGAPPRPLDVGVEEDAGTSVDAAMPVDAAMLVDVAVPVDAMMPVDAAAQSMDAAVPDAAPDAAPPINPYLPRVENETCRLPEPPPIGDYVLEEAFPALDFNRPLWFGIAPDDPDTLYVAEQGGVIYAFDDDPEVEERAVFLQLNVSRRNNEEGLLGVAFHPEYADNGRLFIYYSASRAGCPSGASRCSNISEFRRAAAQRVDPDSERILLSFDQPYGNHNGGDLQFGPDGYLYIAVGDGGSAGDPRNHGQNTETLLGSVLRIDIDAGAPDGPTYGIPADNPFADGEGGRPEIWAWGLRNIWRMTFDDSTGVLWAGDVGQNAYEEIDKIIEPGNYGWRIREGRHCFRANQCREEGLIEPVYEYPRNQGESITGGLVYRGPRLPELWGAYLYADYDTGRFWALREVEGGPPEVTELGRQTGITSFGQDAEGRVYFTTFANRRSIMRLGRRGPVNAAPFPRLLSETGCFADTVEHAVAPGVLPYGVNIPLWSDGATKLRYLALPPGGALSYDADNGYGAPVGTIFIKTFLLANAQGEARRLETRMYTRQASGWRGFTWRWNEEQTDAVLLEGGLNEPQQTPLGEQVWRYPSRVECDQCHTEAAGYTLGWRTPQVNGTFSVRGRRYDQLTALAEAGYIALPGPAAELPVHPGLDDPATPLEGRVRALLDVNCASCHRPGTLANAQLDLRAGTPLAESRTCDVAPGQTALGIADARLIAPGDPARSVLYQRMIRRDDDGMPAVGSNVVDDDGAQLVFRWIEAMERCP